MLETFLANLRHAVNNKETVNLGGGEFTPSELRAVLESINQAVDFERAVVEECFKIEGCLDSKNPRNTVKCLIETNINYSKG